MFNKYSSTLSLVLNLRQSRTRSIIVVLLGACLALALAAQFIAGYREWVYGLTLPSVILLYRLAFAERMLSRLSWQQGVWSVLDGHQRREVVLNKNCICLPWAIWLSWQEMPAGRRGELWLFSDSAEFDDLRRLRALLLAQGRG